MTTRRRAWAPALALLAVAGCGSAGPTGAPAGEPRPATAAGSAAASATASASREAAASVPAVPTSARPTPTKAAAAPSAVAAERPMCELKHFRCVSAADAKAWWAPFPLLRPASGEVTTYVAYSRSDGFGPGQARTHRPSSLWIVLPRGPHGPHDTFYSKLARAGAVTIQVTPRPTDPTPHPAVTAHWKDRVRGHPAHHRVARPGKHEPLLRMVTWGERASGHDLDFTAWADPDRVGETELLALLDGLHEG